MKKGILYFLLLTMGLSVKGQNKVKEFTGVVKYKHNVIAKEKEYDVSYDYSGIGKSSDYYFKDGNIKWLTYNCYFKMDLFIAKENKDYFLTNQSDTIFTLKNNVRDFDIIDYKVEKSNSVILGHKCNVLQLKLKPINSETPITYRRYYFSSDFYIDPKKLEKCTSSAYDIIYGQMKSIPLKIEFEFPNRIVVWEASEIKPLVLDNRFFELEKNVLIGYW